MTYSIVARDPATGQLGVAVQSRWFSVGSIVSWAEPGVGAVATQSFAEVTYGPEGLALMGDGVPAPAALAALVERDEHPEGRQVAMVDAAGRVEVHTGSTCVEAAGHVVGDGVACQANMMERDTVWGAMLQAYSSTAGDLADRLVASLRAAEREGGDMRGRQSAALVVVGAERGDRPWARVVDLRVEDHPDPVGELDRLLTVQRAFAAMDEGDERLLVGDPAGAVDAYARAGELLPGEDQIMFWRAATLAAVGRMDEARELAGRARRAHPKWAPFLRRAAAAGVVPDDRSVLDTLLPLDPGGEP
jgi:uncharacterized Ntn-hydrolase superfamily protein